MFVPEKLVHFHHLHTRFLRGSYKHYVEARSFNHLLQRKSNKYCKLCVCVCSLSYAALKAHALLYISICDLPGCTLVLYFMSITARFPGGGEVNYHKMHVLIFSTNFV